jgi:hypothetical protein
MKFVGGPAGGWAGNLYGYCGGNPIWVRDSSGQDVDPGPVPAATVANPKTLEELFNNAYVRWNVNKAMLNSGIKLNDKEDRKVGDPDIREVCFIVVYDNSTNPGRLKVWPRDFIDAKAVITAGEKGEGTTTVEAEKPAAKQRGADNEEIKLTLKEMQNVNKEFGKDREGQVGLKGTSEGYITTNEPGKIIGFPDDFGKELRTYFKLKKCDVLAFYHTHPFYLGGGHPLGLSGDPLKKSAGDIGLSIMLDLPVIASHPIRRAMLPGGEEGIDKKYADQIPMDFYGFLGWKYPGGTLNQKDLTQAEALYGALQKGRDAAKQTQYDAFAKDWKPDTSRLTEDKANPKNNKYSDEPLHVPTRFYAPPVQPVK